MSGASAFAKGGCGCLIAFFVVGFLVVAAGGSFFIDLGGFILLFVIGGVIGLVVLAIYNRGRNDAIAGNAKRDPDRS
jgi:hypothetical protein